MHVQTHAENIFMWSPSGATLSGWRVLLLNNGWKKRLPFPRELSYNKSIKKFPWKSEWVKYISNSVKWQSAPGWDVSRWSTLVKCALWGEKISTEFDIVVPVNRAAFHLIYQFNFLEVAQAWSNHFLLMRIFEMVLLGLNKILAGLFLNGVAKGGKNPRNFSIPLRFWWGILKENQSMHPFPSDLKIKWHN